MATDLDMVRLAVGDTDETDPLLLDDEIQALLDKHATDSVVQVTAAAADAASAIAAKFARGYNFTTDGQSFNRSERVNHYTALAYDLRQRMGGNSVPVISPTSIDDGLTLGRP